MRPTLERGLLAITVGVRPAARSSGQAKLLPFIRRLQECRLPLCIAVATPSHELLSTLADAAPAADWALIAEPDWAGPTAHRSRFGSELSRGISLMRASGCIVEAVLMDAELRADRFDLVVKQGIRAIGRTDQAISSLARIGAAPLRHGLFAVPVAAAWPRNKPGWFASRETMMGRQLRRAIARREVLHWTLDADCWQTGGGAQGKLVRVLERARLAVERGQLHASTLRGVAATLSPERLHPAATSILRSAA